MADKCKLNQIDKRIMRFLRKFAIMRNSYTAGEKFNTCIVKLQYVNTVISDQNLAKQSSSAKKKTIKIKISEE